MCRAAIGSAIIRSILDFCSALNSFVCLSWMVLIKVYFTVLGCFSRNTSTIVPLSMASFSGLLSVAVGLTISVGSARYRSSLMLGAILKSPSYEFVLLCFVWTVYEMQLPFDVAVL